MSHYISVLDTETNWNDEVMSIGVVIADKYTYEVVDKRYYVLTPEYKLGGMYSDVIAICKGFSGTRKQAMDNLKQWLSGYDVTSLFAYNARFDCMHLRELQSFRWFDIMRIAAYRQYNTKIPDYMECCTTGRLKHNYGVEPILRMLSGDCSYCEKHNALCDAIDELNIMKLLNLDIDIYEVALI